MTIDNSKIEEAKKRLGDKTADLIAEILEVENYWSFGILIPVFILDTLVFFL